MIGIERYDVNEEWAHSGIVKGGDTYYLNYCAGIVGGPDGLLFQVDGVAYAGNN